MKKVHAIIFVLPSIIIASLITYLQQNGSNSQIVGRFFTHYILLMMAQVIGIILAMEIDMRILHPRKMKKYTYNEDLKGYSGFCKPKEPQEEDTFDINDHPDFLFTKDKDYEYARTNDNSSVP